MSTTLWKPFTKSSYISRKADIHHDDIRPYLFDIFIANHILLRISKQAAPLVFPGDDQLADLTRTLVKLKVTDPAKPLAVFQVYDFFFFNSENNIGTSEGRLTTSYAPPPERCLFYRVST